MYRYRITSPNRLLSLCALGLLAFCLQPLPSLADAEQYYLRGQAAYQQEDLLTAIDALKSAADMGHARAQSLLGYIYDIAEENELAFSYYQMAADQGDADGAYGLGKLYASGEGTVPDLEQAVRWYQLAAGKGQLLAIDVLATAYLNGGLGLDRDEQKARALLETAAALGHQPSIKRLSEL